MFRIAVALSLMALPVIAQDKGCEVEDFAAKHTGNHLLISGATSCADGRLAYRLYDGEEFLASGTSQIVGFTFQIIQRLDNPANLNMKYVIQ